MQISLFFLSEKDCVRLRLTSLQAVAKRRCSRGMAQGEGAREIKNKTHPKKRVGFRSLRTCMGHFGKIYRLAMRVRTCYLAKKNFT